MAKIKKQLIMSDLEKAKSQDIQPKPKAEIEKKPEGTVKILTYKIAFPTDDGQFINPHFGRAKYFLVLEVEDKVVVNREMRSNDSHQGMPHHQHDHHHEHHNDPEHQAQQKKAHSRIFEILHDVDILIANGMGPGIYNQLIENGYTVFKTKISSIEDALQAYLKGVLKV